MSTLTTFPLFPDLPVEIRLKVWGILLSIPRTITIKCNKAPRERGKLRAVKFWSSNLPPPSLLHINRETRYETLSIYAPYFTTLVSPLSTYLNFSLDTIKFADGTLLYLGPTERNLVEKLVVETKDCSYFGHYNMEIIKQMGALRYLEIWAEKGEPIAWDSGTRYVRFLVSAFEDAVKEDPGWECPGVVIMDVATGVEVGAVEGGARIPGWTEETRHLFEEVED